ncbi:acyltransferase [Paenibacillus barcinonensis]|uniref:Acyltransferase n=1 Tax=Paenibacillus barcinonensis TaxID=198119 RepID=A0A2V4W9D6_PAEBA|nr:acyltransferase [Paenibacillus barcinonensis]PYE44254.1 peptidoglycan/LPS O-acetylase OafA/YrhL [Paenibacillus barcinonensis]QKS57629.1 acyltransferase [Paenibacillus barcinonensis]
MNQTLKRERIPELNLVRAIAIIGVLFVHSTSNATLEMTDSRYYWLYNFINIFMKYGTPTFIFLSSFVLFYNYYTRPLDKKLVSNFYKKRFVYILLPYFLFSILYFVVLHNMYYQGRPFDESLITFIEKLFTGKAYTHLYFVFINMQFYLIFPLVLWLLKKYPSVVKWSVPIGLFIQWAFIVSNKYGFQVPNKGSWALSYFSYFMLGAYMGAYFPQIKQWFVISKANATKGRVASWIVLWTVWITAGLAHVYIYYLLRLKIATYNTLWYELFWNVHTFACALVIIQIAYWLYHHGPALIVKPLNRLGTLSFGIYLIHPFFLLFYREHPPQTGVSSIIHLWYASGFGIALIASWIVVGLAARFLPYAWILFGNLPKPKPRFVPQQKSGQVDMH